MNIRDRYEDSYLAVLLHGAARKIHKRYVYYGTMRDGVGAWGCNVSTGNGTCERGGYCPNPDDAKRAAEDHAKTHQGVRAFHYKG